MELSSWYLQFTFDWGTESITVNRDVGISVILNYKHHMLDLPRHNQRHVTIGEHFNNKEK